MACQPDRESPEPAIEAARAALATPVPASVAPLPSAGCAAAPAAPATGESIDLEVGERRRRYILDAPASAGNDPRPVILALHGFGDSAEGFRNGLRLHEYGNPRGAIVAYAQGSEGVELLNTVGRGWDLVAGPDHDFVTALLDDVEARRCVDRRRVYATGFSNGGFFSNHLGCVLADRLAAVAPVGGAAELPECTSTRPVPVLLMHGAADRIVDPKMVTRARNWWAGRNDCGAAVTAGECVWFRECAADVVHCEGPQAHRWPRDGIERLWRFFEAHPLPAD